MMARDGRMWTAARPDGRRLYAYCDPRVRLVEGRAADSRLLACLRPFRSDADARDALAGAGCRQIAEDRP